MIPSKPAVIFAFLTIIQWINLSQSVLYKDQNVVTEESQEKFLEKWKNFESKLKTMLDGTLQNWMPSLSRSFYELELSDECLADMLKLMLALRQHKTWAFSMIDATGKPLDGMLSGTMVTLGSYDQCLAISVPDRSGEELFKGQYCNAEFRFPLPPKPWFYRIDKLIEPLKSNYTEDDTIFSELRKLTQIFYTVAIRYGVCTPSTCSREDVTKMASLVTQALEVSYEVTHCETKKKAFDMDTVQIAIAGVFGFFFAMMIIGTIVDVSTSYNGEDKHRNLLTRFMVVFSFRENTRKLFDTDNTGGEDSLPALHGFRVLTITWVVLGHAYFFIDWQMYQHFRNAIEMISHIEFQTITNASVSVDGFFLLSGLLLSYGIITNADKKGQKTFNVPLMLFRRIWRILPTTMMVVGLAILLPLISSGPFWHESVELAADNCRKNWWAVLVFGNNYIYPKEACLVHTWYVATDMQLYIFGLVFLLLMLRKQLLGNLFSGLMVIAGIISIAIVTFIKNLTPTMLSVNPDVDQRSQLGYYVYFQTYGHIASYGIGLSMGALLSRYRKVRIHPVWHVAGWIVAILLCGVSLYGTFVWSDRVPTITESILFASLHRVSWTLGLCWMIYACCTGYGGFINTFLSWKFFLPLSRLTFVIYLVHVLVIQSFYGTLRNAFECSNFMIVWLFFGHLTVSVGVSYICRVLFEAPFIELERLLLSKVLGPTAKEPVDETVVPKPGEELRVMSSKPHRNSHLHDHANVNGQGNGQHYNYS